MKTINYKLSNGTIQTIEVSDEFATNYEQIEREDRQAEERKAKVHKWGPRRQRAY